MALESLTLMDYSDRELLHIVWDVCQANEDACASSYEIAEALGIDSKTKNLSVGSRMAALRVMEIVDRLEDATPARWYITPVGQEAVFGEPRVAQRRAVEEAGVGQLLMLTRVLAEHQRTSPYAAGHLLRREWHRTTHIG